MNFFFFLWRLLWNLGELGAYPEALQNACCLAAEEMALPPAAVGMPGQSHARLGPDLFRSCVEPQSWARIQAHFRNVQFTEPDTNLLSLHAVPLVQRQLTLVPITASASKTQSKSKNRAASSTSKDSTAWAVQAAGSTPAPSWARASARFQEHLLGAHGCPRTAAYRRGPGSHGGTMAPSIASQAQLGAGCRGGRGFLLHASPRYGCCCFCALGGCR